MILKRKNSWVLGCFIAFIVLCNGVALAQIPKDNSDDFIINVLKSSPDWFQQILYNPMEYQVQIVYTQINRDSSNRAHFTTHTFQADEFYFYPASWMKLPLAIFSLEKLNELKLGRNNCIKIEPLFGNHNHEYDDFLKIQSPSFSKLIKQAFIVSDNSVYNPLYDFVTQQRANQRFAELGLKKAVICNRFSVSDPAEHRHSNFLEILSNSKDQKVLYQQIQSFNPTQPHCTFPAVEFGEKHYEKNVLTVGPKNFYYNNYIPITEMDLFMRKLFFPKETRSTFNLTKDDYKFLKKYLAMLPRLNQNPKYNETDFHDSYMKYFLIGGSKERLDNSVRIFDKLGQYFGWTTDAAYIVDYSSGVEFFLSAVIYTNSQHIVADNPNEYTSIAAPFFAQLGKSFFEYEQKRKKKFEPHLNFVSLSMDDEMDAKNEEMIVVKKTSKNLQQKASTIPKHNVVNSHKTNEQTAEKKVSKPENKIKPIKKSQIESEEKHKLKTETISTKKKVVHKKTKKKKTVSSVSK